MNKDVLFSSASEEWETPQEFFDKLDAVFHFQLDAAASHENHKCKKYFTKQDDSLTQQWIVYDSIYLNPPYGRGMDKWMLKCHQTSMQSDSVIVCLLPARTDTKWFHNYNSKYAKNIFLPGRLKFGNSVASAPFPSLVSVFSSYLGLFSWIGPVYYSLDVFLDEVKKTPRFKK